MMLFWNFIYERQQIFKKRYIDKLPPPWTEDEILKTFKFTNVYRELDRGTLFYEDRIIQPIENSWIKDYGEKVSFKELLFRTFIYRHFNDWNTWNAIESFVIERDWRGMEDALLRLPRVYTNAHNVTGFQFAGAISKVENSMYLIQNLWYANLDKIVSHLWAWRGNMGESWEYMQKHVPGLGGFTAYEVVVDLSYSSLTTYTDDDWVNPGPGCRRGLNRIFPFLGNNLTECRKKILQLRNDQRKFLPPDFYYWHGKDLTLRNIEHCLCEYSKYAKSFFDEGRPRNKFVACFPEQELTYAE
jgi:hypothetical protein